MQFRTKIFIVILLILSFLLGYSLNNFSNIFSSGKEIPYSGFVVHDLISPHNFISEDKIFVLKDKIMIKIENASLASYTTTHSMDPIIDSGAHGLEIKPKSAEEIKLGDIVAYKSIYSKEPIVHRIIKISSDEKGVYYTLKGDNNKYNDLEKVRFNQIEYVLIGILY